MRKIAVGLLGVIALGMAFALPAKADDPAKITYAYFEGPVEVPGGKILPQGVYAFEMVDDSSPSNKVVQIYLALPGGTVGTPSAFNQNKQMKLEATVLLVADYHTRPAQRAVTYWPVKDGGASPLRTLSFPVGQVALVFVYPHERAAELAKATNRPVPSVADLGGDVNALKTATIKATSANGGEVDEVQVYGKPGDHPADRALGEGCKYEAGDIDCQFNPGEIRD